MTITLKFTRVSYHVFILGLTDCLSLVTKNLNFIFQRTFTLEFSCENSSDFSYLTNALILKSVEYSLIKSFSKGNIFWGYPSLSELTPIISNMELTSFGSEASI